MHLFRRFGPRSDQAHVSLEHVEKLGQLVELPSSECGTGSRDAAVARRRDNATLASDAHRSKFPDAERLAVFANAYLAEEDRRTIVQNHHQSDTGKDWHKKYQPSSGTSRVEEPLESLVRPST
jgi:hypothetical protein